MAKAKIRLSKPRKGKKFIMRAILSKRWKKVMPSAVEAQCSIAIDDTNMPLVNFHDFGSTSTSNENRVNIASDCSSEEESSDCETETETGCRDSQNLESEGDAEESFDDSSMYIEAEYELPENKTTGITGRRIVEISYFLNQLKSLKHEGFGCSFFDLSPISEKIEGLQSILSFKCSVCSKVDTVRYGNPETSTTNVAAVVGTLAIGIGHSQLSELFAAMDMPTMSNKTYIKCHSEISRAIEEENSKLMNIAAKEEAKLAVECGDVNKDGIPIISVVVDGAWSKRSYRTNYNALSGVACIIGAKTKKILYMGVKNKYCFACARRGISEDHTCFKNWSNSSTGMEAAIIADGFQRSISQQNLIYGKVIGDGDSNVYKKLTEMAPYGPTFFIEKIECRNHLLRNYLNKLSEIAKLTKFPIALRKKVTSSETLCRFRNAVTKAIYYRSKEDTQKDHPWHIKTELLKKDIMNGPKHIFGDHSYCEGYFGTKNKEGEENLVPDLIISGLFDVIKIINKRLADNTCSLLYDVDTNSAETYNSVVAKFVGGKRINFSLKNSYEVRCKAAAISFNTKGNFLNSIHKELCGNSPGQHTKIFWTRQQSRKSRGTKKLYKKKLFATVDDEYGLDTTNPIEDMTAELYKKKSEEFLEELRTVDREEIFRKTILQSESDEWKRERKGRLTASHFGKICKLRKTTSTAKTIEALLYSTFKGNSATKFGLQSEDTVRSLFENKYACNIEKSGLIIDDELPFLACSPDGLIGDNAIIEIKSSTTSGDLSPIEAVAKKKIKYCNYYNGAISLKRNHDYFFQIQGLLHISKREICYFVIYSSGGLHVEEIKRDETFWTDKMEGKLSEFFTNSLLPELVDSRRCREQHIRNIYMT